MGGGKEDESEVQHLPRGPGDLYGNEGAVHNNAEDVQEMDLRVTSCRGTSVVVVATELVGDDDGLVVWSRFMSVYPAWSRKLTHIAQ